MLLIDTRKPIFEIGSFDPIGCRDILKYRGGYLPRLRNLFPATAM